MREHASQAAVDYGFDTLYRDGAFGDVGRTNDFPGCAWGDGKVLLFGTKIAVQWQQLRSGLAGNRLTGQNRFPDFGCSWQED
jgi:hypothetical protein